MTQGDLFDWADSQPAPAARPSAIIIEALPWLLAKIRMEKAYCIPRPRRDAKIIENPKWHERSVA